MKKILLGLVGTSGAGKSTVGLYLKKKGFYLVELSSFLKKEAKKRKIRKIDKRILQDLGNKLRENFGPSVLAELAIKEIKRKKASRAVIDGIRNLAEVNFLKKQKNFHLLGITAKSSLRYQRIIKLHGKKYIGSYKSFLEVEKRDSSLGNEDTGLRTKDCLKQADYQINNNYSRKDLYQKIEHLIKNI